MVMLMHCPGSQHRFATVWLPVSLIPASLRSSLLHQHHDVPQAGHLCPGKTAGRIRQIGYWVGMLKNIDQYCQTCRICQACKLPAPPQSCTDEHFSGETLGNSRYLATSSEQRPLHFRSYSLSYYQGTRSSVQSLWPPRHC